MEQIFVQLKKPVPAETPVTPIWHSHHRVCWSNRRYMVAIFTIFFCWMMLNVSKKSGFGWNIYIEKINLSSCSVDTTCCSRNDCDTNLAQPSQGVLINLEIHGRHVLEFFVECCSMCQKRVGLAETFSLKTFMGQGRSKKLPMTAFVTGNSAKTTHTKWQIITNSFSVKPSQWWNPF